MDALIHIAFLQFVIGAHGGAHALREPPGRCQQGLNETETSVNPAEDRT